jgi:hypothetical protein
MTSEHRRDPWVDVRTRHDFPADEVISALQKEMRRGNAENGVLLAYEWSPPVRRWRPTCDAVYWPSPSKT